MSNGIEKPKGTNGLDHESEEQLLCMQAVRTTNAIAFPMILKTALEIGVVDVIYAATSNGAFVTALEVARGLPTKPTNPDAHSLLDRMLRVLTSYSIVRCHTVGTDERVENSYSIAPVGRFFVQNNADSESLGSMFLLMQDDVFLRTWERLGDTIMVGGDSAFKRAHGTSLFEYTSSDQRFNKRFNRAMSDYTRLIMEKVLDVYKGFQHVNVLVDVGGGIGTNLSIITAKYPHIKAINFDMPSVLANAPSFPGVHHVGGDMFIDVPKGDAIYMKCILHDWNDENSLKILKNCYEALPPTGKLIIVETIHSRNPKDDDIYSNIVSDLDMTMLAQCSGGKERTREEFEALSINSGFSKCRFLCMAYHFWVIEFDKALNA